jgi:type I restriction enzyme S subunit
MSQSDRIAPPGWTWTTLGEIAVDLIGGGTPSRKVAEFFGGSIPWFTPTEVPKDRISILHKSRENITDLGFSKSSARMIPAGSVMLTSRASIGYVGIAGTDVTTNQGFASIVCPPELLNFYVAYWLWSIRSELDSRATGTTFKEISKAKLREFCFPLPPLPEQHRIVEKIEALFSELEKGIEQLKTAQQQLKVYRQAVLKWAFEGKLTEEWRNNRRHPERGSAATESKGVTRMAAEPAVPYDHEHPSTSLTENVRSAQDDGDAYESAQELLARIRNEREALAKASGKRLKPITPLTEKELAELPELPEGWAWVKLGEVSAVQVGFAFRSSEFKKEGIRLLRGENIEPGRLRWSDTQYWDPKDIESYRNLALNENDVILAMDRPIVSSGLKIALVRKSDLPALLVQRVARIRYVENRYLFFCISSQRFINHCLGKQTGTQLPHISGGQIESFGMALPPLAEQHQIVQEIESRLSVCDKLEETITASLQQSESLRQSILKKAFEGRLVPQDPSDPPASELLERIKKEKAPERRNASRTTPKHKRTSPSGAT